MWLWLIYSTLFFSVQAQALSVDCEGDCSQPNYESKVMPDRKPAVVLQEELESIARKGNLKRGPAVVLEGEDGPLEEISPVCKNNFIYTEYYKDEKKCP